MHFIGIDPGKKGGLVAIQQETTPDVRFNTMPATEVEIWRWFEPYSSPPIRKIKESNGSFAIIEKIVPAFKGTGKAQMAKLFGSYMALRMALTAAGIKFQEVGASEMHRFLGIRARKKTEKKTDWKNRLKSESEKRFPNLKITHNTADALLIAYYCRERVRMISVAHNEKLKKEEEE
jgi:hypothetical protein